VISLRLRICHTLAHIENAARIVPKNVAAELYWVRIRIALDFHDFLDICNTGCKIVLPNWHSGPVRAQSAGIPRLDQFAKPTSKQVYCMNCSGEIDPPFANCGKGSDAGVKRVLVSCQILELLAFEIFACSRLHFYPILSGYIDLMVYEFL
jgi:hypothetical protein